MGTGTTELATKADLAMTGRVFAEAVAAGAKPTNVEARPRATPAAIVPLETMGATARAV